MILRRDMRVRGVLLGIFLSGAAFFLSPGTQAADEVPAVSLTSTDIPKIVILLTKPSDVLVEVTYSKPKQEEFLALTRTGLPKMIRIAINGRTVAERLQTKPATGHSFKIPMDSLDAAIAFAATTAGVPPAGASPAPLPATDEAPSFALSPADVTKMALFIIKPNRTRLDLSCTPGKREALAALAAAHPDERIRIVAGEKPIAEIPSSTAHGEGAISIELPSQSGAFMLLRLLAGANTEPAAVVK